MPRTMARAKLAIMAEVPYVQKVYSEGLRYAFASEREFIERLRPAMVRNGVSVHPTSVELIQVGDYTTSNNKQMSAIILRVTYKFVHHPSGEFEQVQVMAEASDSSDKKTAKCMTIALKYALRQWLLVETGDDPDIVAHHRESPKSELFKRAARGVESANDRKRLGEIKASVQKNSGGFSPDEQQDLLKFIDKREGELK